MFQNIKNGIIVGFSASLTIILIGITYAAWNDIINSGDPLTATSWNNLVQKISDNSYAADIPTMVRITGLGPEENTDNGGLTSRSLNFTKTRSDTAIKVSYTDNFRVTTGGNACRWEIQLNGASCSSGALVYDQYGVDNIHRSQTLQGYCDSLPAGNYTIGISVGNVPGSATSDCHTGWNTSRWLLDAQEVYISSNNTSIYQP